MKNKDNPDKHFTCTFHIVFALWVGLSYDLQKYW